MEKDFLGTRPLLGWEQAGRPPLPPRGNPVAPESQQERPEPTSKRLRVSTNYNRGRTAEYKVMGELKKREYYVTRSAGSHGVFDLIGVPLSGKGPVLLVQVKTGKPTNAEQHILETFVSSPHWTKYFAIVVPREPTAYWMVK